jgi:hypothetical protein
MEQATPRAAKDALPGPESSERSELGGCCIQFLRGAVAGEAMVTLRNRTA